MSNKRVAVKNKNYKQLWAVALNTSKEGVAADQNLREVMGCNIKCEQWMGCSWSKFASSYGLQHQKSEQQRIAAKQNREQLWTASLKGSAIKGLQLIMSRIKQRNQETNLIVSLRAPMKVQTSQGKNKFSLIEPHMILWEMWSKKYGSDYLELSPGSL